MPTLWANNEWEIDSDPYGGRAGLPPPVGPHDKRIPPPAPDTASMELGGLVLPNGSPAATPSLEEEVSAKIGIYARTDGDFTISVLDADNDPVEGGSFRFSAADIVGKVKPMLEAASHKVVDYSAGALTESASGGKVKQMRRRASAE